MNRKERDQYIIDRYKEDEETMIFAFAQWCHNHGLDAHDLYERAYPKQMKNKALDAALEQVLPKEEADMISQEVVISLLQMFGNDDLAFEVAQIKLK